MAEASFTKIGLVGRRATVTIEEAEGKVRLTLRGTSGAVRVPDHLRALGVAG